MRRMLIITLLLLTFFVVNAFANGLIPEGRGKGCNCPGGRCVFFCDK